VPHQTRRRRPSFAEVGINVEVIDADAAALDPTRTADSLRRTNRVLFADESCPAAVLPICSKELSMSSRPTASSTFSPAALAV
jgi:pyruvate/2-oxoglutarate/acetoin dehydrogenase E1 component